MKPARAQWFTLAALTVFFLGITWGLFAHRAGAMTISNPSATSIGGVAPCAGPLVSGAPLVYNGSTVCTGPANATALSMTNAAGGAQTVMTVDTSDNLTIGDTAHPVLIANGATFTTPNNGINFDGNADLTEIRAPRTPLTLVTNLVTGSGSTTANVVYTPTVAMHVRAWDIGLAAALSSCSPYPTLEVAVAGSGQSASAIT